MMMEVLLRARASSQACIMMDRWDVSTRVRDDAIYS